VARLSSPPTAHPDEVAEVAASRTLTRSFYFAWQGVRQAWRQEKNFRLEAAISLAALALGSYLDVGLVSLALIILCCVLVLTFELLNTALEATIDLFTPDYHPLAKIAKDAAAAAVLLACLGAALIGLLLLGPPLWQRLVG